MYYNVIYNIYILYDIYVIYYIFLFYIIFLLYIAYMQLITEQKFMRQSDTTKRKIIKFIVIVGDLKTPFSGTGRTSSKNYS